MREISWKYGESTFGGRGTQEDASSLVTNIFHICWVFNLITLAWAGLTAPMSCRYIYILRRAYSFQNILWLLYTKNNINIADWSLAPTQVTGHQSSPLSQFTHHPRHYLELMLPSDWSLARMLASDWLMVIIAGLRPHLSSGCWWMLQPRCKHSRQCPGGAQIGLTLAYKQPFDIPIIPNVNTEDLKTLLIKHILTCLQSL